MKRTADYLFLFGAIAFGIGFSGLFLGWLPIEYQTAYRVVVYGVLFGSICIFSAVILLAIHWFQEGRCHE
jgi:hypothetical protein